MQQNKKRSNKGLAVLLLLLLLIAGGAFLLTQLPSAVQASSVDEPVAAAENVAVEPAAVVENVEVVSNVERAEAAAVIDGNDKLLVWVGVNEAPGKHSASNPGQLVLMESDGSSMQPVMDIPPQTTRVVPCGDNATSPDGKHFAFYVGLDTGTLYIMTGTDMLAPVGSDLKALMCMSGDYFQYSSDSSQFAYIAFEPTADSDEFADGWLHIASTETKADLVSYPNVAAFDMIDNKVAFVRFFTNDRGEADEAGIFMWDGQSEIEVATIFPNEDCRFTSAELAVAADGRLVLVMGHRCKSGDTRTSWQFYVVDTGSRSATLSMSDFQPGAFFSYTDTNNAFFSPDSSTVYFTVPDGITARTTALVAVDMAAISPDNILIPNHAVMPNYDNKPYNFDAQSPMTISSDGRWLAVVTATPTGDTAVNVLDLSDPSLPPITVPAGRSGDVISDMDFSPTNSHLIFVSGGSGGAENSLLAIDLNSGSDYRIKRGRFGRGVVSTDGTVTAIMDWQQVEDPKEPLYVNLVLVDTNNGATTTLFEGATIVEGKVTDQQFAYPLAWRRN